MADWVLDDQPVRPHPHPADRQHSYTQECNDVAMMLISILASEYASRAPDQFEQICWMRVRRA